MTTDSESMSDLEKKILLVFLYQIHMDLFSVDNIDFFENPYDAERKATGAGIFRRAWSPLCFGRDPLIILGSLNRVVSDLADCNFFRYEHHRLDEIIENFYGFHDEKFINKFFLKIFTENQRREYASLVRRLIGDPLGYHQSNMNARKFADFFTGFFYDDAKNGHGIRQYASYFFTAYIETRQWTWVSTQLNPGHYSGLLKIVHSIEFTDFQNVEYDICELCTTKWYYFEDEDRKSVFVTNECDSSHIPEDLKTVGSEAFVEFKVIRNCIIAGRHGNLIKF